MSWCIIHGEQTPTVCKACHDALIVLAADMERERDRLREAIEQHRRAQQEYSEKTNHQPYSFDAALWQALEVKP